MVDGSNGTGRTLTTTEQRRIRADYVLRGEPVAQLATHWHVDEDTIEHILTEHLEDGRPRPRREVRSVAMPSRPRPATIVQRARRHCPTPDEVIARLTYYTERDNARYQRDLRTYFAGTADAYGND